MHSVDQLPQAKIMHLTGVSAQSIKQKRQTFFATVLDERILPCVLLSWAGGKHFPRLFRSGGRIDNSSS
jgi:hypothetical protein